jgi:cell surface protein SprA
VTLSTTYTHRLAVAFAIVLSVISVQVLAQVPAKDSTVRFSLSDRFGDPYTYRNKNTFDFNDSSYLKRNVEYDPVTKQYYIIEKTGGRYYRTPMTYSMSEFLSLKGKQDENEYFRKRAALLANLNRRQYKPKFNFVNDWVNRITGNGKIEIKPSGYVDILAGYQGQNIKNPTLPERARKNGGFDFNMNSQLQVDGNIGDKLKLPINYNTLANFDFENQLKLDYRGKEDEILKQFQLGNVNFNSKGSLIPGAQSLFGIKTQLQFGKLFITSVFANQKSQRQSLGLQGGTASQPFSIKADEYEENKHFLLGQYFRNNYKKTLEQLPIVKSAVQILRMEVWVTNRTGTTTDTRDVVGLMDLGEGKPFDPAITSPGNVNALPYNDVNGLYTTVKSLGRNTSQIQNLLTGIGLRPVQDFEKTFARKLTYGSEYIYNRQVGYISLNQQLQPDEVLAVAYQYTYNGRVYQVGEFSTDVPPDTTARTQNVLFLKLLKATSQRTNLPIWDLMMKNIYAVGYGQLERQDFTLDIVYEEPSLGEKRYLPPAPVVTQYQGQPILSLVNLDRLNNQNDPQPDGKFDYVDSFTVFPQYSRIVFPVLEPFGSDLDYLYSNQADREQYLFYPLYDTIKAIAQTYANLNRFKMTGKSKASANSTGEYQLGFNIPRGSVTVNAGGRVLQEGADYEINYDLGTLRVTNPSILSAGIPVQIQFENQAAGGFQTQNFMATRFDYLVNKKLSLGATVVRLGERPFFTKISYGEDPRKNTMFGLDFDYRNEIPRLSRILDKLPFYSTKANSNITAYGEAAWLKPGHPKQINSDKKNNEGVIYVDDFEGTRNSIDLRFPLISWTLASVPQNNGLFPESALFNDLASGANRAKIAWYNIEPVLQEPRNPNNPLKSNIAELIKPETRQVFQKEIFPQRSTNFNDALLNTFDMTYYPDEKGPYNFESSPAKINANGKLLQPKKAWGGIMRNIDQTDFETGNIEFLETWVQDPFINKQGSTGGQLYFNLGNVSEDIVRDGKRLYENGLPGATNANTPVDRNTVWGQVPANPIQVTTAFSTDPNDRPLQDVGFDGLTDTAEQRKFSPYLNSLITNFGANAPVVLKAQPDPSADNFRNYRDGLYDQQGAGILQRYKDFNNPHGNSAISASNATTLNAFTLYPDQEDLNRDNTLNEQEEYFEYKVDLKPNMQPGSNFITDKRIVDVKLVNGDTRKETWYLFRIPINKPTTTVGNIPDFKSIRFIRMFMTGFEDTVTCRFGKLELIRNQWRRFTYEIDTTTVYKPLPANDPTSLDVLAVNLEENDQREPIPYKQPPGIERQTQLSNNNVNLLQNEQSLSLKLCNLKTKESRGVFKTLNIDMRQYANLKMFVHAESVERSPVVNDGDLKAVVRIGSDFVSNYYEIKIPLKITPPGARDSLSIWPQINNLDFALNDLIKLKSKRNRAGIQPSQYFKEVQADGRSFAIVGNPNLGEVKSMLMAVENARQTDICTEVWFNELRFSKLDEKGGYAALGRIDIAGADLFNLSVSGSVKSSGFGTLEQRVNERSREDLKQIDAAFSMDAGKLLPKKFGIQLPVYAGVSRTISTPEYDPYDLDIKLKQKIKEAAANQKDSIRNDAQDITTIQTVTLTNAKKIKTNGKKPKVWDPSNFDFNYSFIRQQQHNPLIDLNEMRRTRGAVGYTYAVQPKYIEPFKYLIKSKSPWFRLVKDFNFNYKPSSVSVKADVFRQFGAIRPRNVGGGPYKIPETYDKFFTFDRYYNLSWDFTKSIRVDYNAVNNARIDEPAGRIDSKSNKNLLKERVFKGGRNTYFQQEVTGSYQLPTEKFPLLEWTSLRVGYTARYDWRAASLLAREQGNTLGNSQTKNATAELKFEQLYNKSKILREILSDNPVDKTPKIPRRLKVKSEKDSTKMIWVKNKEWKPKPGGAEKFIGQFLMSLKRVGVQYNEDAGTVLPGYTDSTRNLGYNWRSLAPGFDFILGYQPDTAWINKAGNRNLLTRDTLFNAFIQQQYNQRLSLTAQVNPFRDFNIDINVDKTFSKQYSELYKDTSTIDNVGLTRLSPYGAGSFSISYISFQTLFTKFNPNVISETFKRFQDNRIILSQRLGTKNIYNGTNPTPGADGYYLGYGRYAQDVLIPAFVAAYTNKDPLTVKLVSNANPNIRSNPFKGYLPRPNWNITYNGLSRIKGLEKIFTNVTMRHGYQSTLGMNSFNAALLFQDPFRAGFPSFRDPLTDNYIPYFLVPNITIQEAFTPLFGIDMTFTNQLTLNFEYKKSRTLSLSLIDYQLAENRSTEYTFGFNWRKRGVPFLKNLKIGKKDVKLDNDVTFKFDFSLRDDATSNAKLDQATAFPAAGQKVIRIAPSIDYVLNSRVNLKLFFEQNRVIPVFAPPAPVTNTRAGLQVRISLNQ